jgi:hypothetical protein
MELADRLFAVTENGRAADDRDFCDQPATSHRARSGSSRT